MDPLRVNMANNDTLEQMTKQQLVDAVSEKTGQVSAPLRDCTAPVGLPAHQ
jgi:hypothetical protein